MSELVKNWEAVLNKVFPSGVPSQASWSNSANINGVLSDIGALNTAHMFFPDGGGEDLTGSTSKKGEIELHSGDPSHGAYIIKASSLEFHCLHGKTLSAYFMLNLSPISNESKFPDSANDYREEFGESSGQTYTLNEFNSNTDRNGDDLPRDTRRIARFWGGGKIAIFAKAAPYNNQQFTNSAFGFDAYDAYHMKTAEFQKVIQKITEIYK